MLTCIPPLLPPTIRSLIVVRQVCLYGLLAAFCPASAAQAQYRFDSWTADNGLPQNSIHAIHQARDGYLWLATSDGLVRFERAQLLGGKPVIHSAPGQGTIIGVKIALPDQAVRDDGR